MSAPTQLLDSDVTLCNAKTKHHIIIRTEVGQRGQDEECVNNGTFSSLPPNTVLHLSFIPRSRLSKAGYLTCVCGHGSMYDNHTTSSISEVSTRCHFRTKREMIAWIKGKKDAIGYKRNDKLEFIGQLKSMELISPVLETVYLAVECKSGDVLPAHSDALKKDGTLEYVVVRLEYPVNNYYVVHPKRAESCSSVSGAGVPKSMVSEFAEQPIPIIFKKGWLKRSDRVLHFIHDFECSDSDPRGYDGFARQVCEDSVGDYISEMASLKRMNKNRYHQNQLVFGISEGRRFGRVINIVTNRVRCFDDLELYFKGACELGDYDTVLLGSGIYGYGREDVKGRLFNLQNLLIERRIRLYVWLGENERGFEDYVDDQDDKSVATSINIQDDIELESDDTTLDDVNDNTTYLQEFMAEGGVKDINDYAMDSLTLSGRSSQRLSTSNKGVGGKVLESMTVSDHQVKDPMLHSRVSALSLIDFELLKFCFESGDSDLRQAAKSIMLKHLHRL
ncbi:uncharacterized protein LOC116171612 isoform X2 [Photinus pyralis]|uniref:uncharacterized protein LOC116159752 n=1 Tax=Photinus pyralis TaxID=7054 RepID=UPI0012677104|nr:uncharacterized protein LOC116159752 [Photinus pyralis]XP_031328799.1 uncharacterized protein LOC116159854 isoform X2 [Photinus pyralis]XP_031329388.1 uncharacterized protein LOC116160340 [Photinus pyralis]XP_031344425.1 uncharacterized protein LOC116171612 isoform X2 [Photinus pyralis]